MKKIKLLVLMTFLSLFSVVLTSCGTFSGYDDDAAIAKGSSFSTYMSSTNETLTSFTLDCEKCNGVKKLKDITVPENPIFDMTLTIESGRFKVVLVKDKIVFLICDSNTQTPISSAISSGKYSLRIVAEDAKIDFAIKYNSYK